MKSFTHNKVVKSGMEPVTRRAFVSALTGACLLCGCKGAVTVISRKISLCRVKDVNFGRNIFELERVMVVKDNNGLYAISLVCTHQECMVAPDDTGFQCRCHGAVFNSEGVPMSGPARRDLPRFHIQLLGEFIEVDLGREVPKDWRLKV